ncbi:uncharacterized protein LOC108624424 [Ceratina calcarata]|uniref:Uncharacterized protein LOC108624424 n=1 Tax=Ceratina calcarata TaxID=156304 RepID=A0AAJ7IY17_9HYME|nr:uncharacterized protein LOC108624424 [Ceratina calcarata]
MNRFDEGISRRRSTPEGLFNERRSSSEESSTLATADSPRLKSTPLGPRDDLKEIDGSRRGPRKIERVLSGGSHRFHRRRIRKKSRERVDGGSERRRDRRKKRRHRLEDENHDEEQKDSSGSSNETHGDSDVKPERSKRKRDDERTNELPITEILKRSQENARTKYEDQSPLPVLVTDKVYVQRKDGFSAIKMNQSRDERKRASEENIDEDRNAPPIRLAIAIQRLWKNTGFFHQGLLAGMALMHCAMLHVFFDVSTEFIVKYSILCEIYTNAFSFLIAVCVVSTFDKFDLARFDVDHLRELYFEYDRAVIAIPLYLIALCLHLVCARTDTRLGLTQYRNNFSAWENTTDVSSLIDDLSSWQKITTSKDLLVTFAWVFVSLGTKDDSFLTYLRSMEKYTNDVESSNR